MSKLVNHRSKDDAVSPVVGVMLMIVVTVVIAAVVALFATNVVTSTEAAPVVVMDMNAYYSSSSDDNTKVVMSMRGGDPLELSKLTVVLTESTGTYGFSVTGLDTKSGTTHLKVGEKLTVVSKTDAKSSSNLITPIGGTIEEVLEVFGTEYNVGKKVHVMVTFNENSIIYDKDIIVKAGTEKDEVVVTLDVSTESQKGITWTNSSGGEIKSGTFTFSSDKVKVTANDVTNANAAANAVSSGSASTRWSVTMADSEDENTSVTLFAELNETKKSAGYKISGICVGNAVIGDGGSQTITATGTPLDLTTKVEIPTTETYTVTYNPGDGEGTPFEEQGVEAGEYQLLSTMPEGWNAPSGKTLDGWTVDGETKHLGGTITVSDDVTATAIWVTPVVVGHTVTLNSVNGISSYEYMIGSETSYTTYTAPFTVSDGSKLKLNANIADGYTFTEWASGKTDNPLTIDSVTSDISYTPTVSPNTYSITYKDQGGSDFSGTHGSGYPTKHTYGTATTLVSPTKTDYTFDGWFTDSACTGTAVTTLGATEYTSDIILYAKWTASRHTVTFDDTTNMTISGSYGSGTSFNSGDEVPADVTVTITATQKSSGSGYRIAAENWEVTGVTGTPEVNMFTFTMPSNSNVAVSATESFQQHTITLADPGSNEYIDEWEDPDGNILKSFELTFNEGTSISGGINYGAYSENTPVATLIIGDDTYTGVLNEYGFTEEYNKGNTVRFECTASGGGFAKSIDIEAMGDPYQLVEDISLNIITAGDVVLLNDNDYNVYWYDSNNTRVSSISVTPGETLTIGTPIKESTNIVTITANGSTYTAKSNKTVTEWGKDVVQVRVNDTPTEGTSITISKPVGVFIAIYST